MPGSGGEAPPRDESRKSFDLVDFKQYIHVVVKRIWLVAICFVVALSFMVIKLARQVPMYQATSVLLLSRGLPLPRQLKQEEIQIFGDYVETQKQIIQSSTLITRARERVNRPAAEMAEKILSVSVSQRGRTAFVQITVKGLDPVLCADYANALAEEYINFKAEEQLDTSQATVISLTQQANRLHDELKRAEERLMSFARENSVVGIQELGNIAASKLAELAGKAASHRTERMLMEAQQPLMANAADDTVLTTLTLPGASLARIAGMASTARGTNMTLGGESPESLIDYGVVSQPNWESLKRRKTLLESRLAAYRKKYRDAHPLVQETLVELNDVEQALDVELQFALRQYYATLESLSIREQAALRVQKEWEDQALEVTRKAQEYRNIEQNYNRISKLYDLVYNRLKEVDISIGIEPDSVQVIELASVPSRPITPRKIQSLFLAAVVGLGIGLALVFGLEYIDDSVRYPEEITRGLQTPFLGIVPAATWDPDDLRAHTLANIDQKSGLAEAYRNIRSALLMSRREHTIKTLAITSAVPKEGKTTTSLNLAISLAQAGARVLLCDCDLRRGEVHKFFGLEGGRGMSDVLNGQAKPDAVIQRTSIPRLDIVATGPFPPNPSEIVLSPEMRAFIEQVERTYDWVLFDCPPVMAVSEAPIVAAMADKTLVVVWGGHTSKKLAQISVQVLRERGADILGCVLNNVEFSRVGYYYYSTYYGYYHYDYYYGKDEAAT